ncbi:MAG: hypothetical protein ABL879_12925 [Devosia sp.]
MSLDSLVYLLEIYWPFLTGALVIGAAAGWYGGTRRKPEGN